MPRFFGQSQLQTAIMNRAMPTLEQLASNPNHVNNYLNNRFEFDDPPPYVSSSESEEAEALHHPVLAGSREAALEKFRDLVRKPLSDNECEGVVHHLNGTDFNIYRPGGRYDTEARREHDRLDTFYLSMQSNSHAVDLLKGPKGYQRRSVIVRRNIRKRWQRLGIWNPEWGIPGRINPQPSDYTRKWK
jgi:hypothetical protein